jgi:hypothetical protein
MTNGLLIHIWGNICAFPHVLGSLPHIWLCNWTTLNFLIYVENFILFFISVEKNLLLCLLWALGKLGKNIKCIRNSVGEIAQISAVKMLRKPIFVDTLTRRSRYAWREDSGTWDSSKTSKRAWSSILIIVPWSIQMDSHINNFSNKIREEKYEKGNKFSCFCVSPLRLLKVLTPTPDGLYVAWEKKQLFRKPFQSF